MVMFWTLFLLISSILLETAYTNKISKEKTLEDKVPFSRSLGFSLRGDFGKTLESARAEDNMEFYNEMLKDNQAAAENFVNDDEISTDLVRLKGIAERRRSVRMQSVAGRRRARSQALRRDKLNSQSLKSHREHSKQSSLEQR